MPANYHGGVSRGRLSSGTRLTPRAKSPVSIPKPRGSNGNHSIKRQIQLSCGCLPWFYSPVPAIGSCLTCRAHGTQLRVNPLQYFVKCEDCRYSRKNLGSAPITADTVACKHGVSRRHRVKIWAETEHHEVVTVKYVGTQNQLSLSDDPPF
jgi:hypothetical protein